MNPHPRIRRAAKWAGLAASVLLLIVWLSSAWWRVYWDTSALISFELGHGSFTVLDYRPPDEFAPPVSWYRMPEPSGARYRLSLWYFWAYYSKPRYWIVSVPLWALIVPLALATGACWRLDSRARRREIIGTCPGCGYGRRGLPVSAECPECGRAG